MDNRIIFIIIILMLSGCAEKISAPDPELHEEFEYFNETSINSNVISLNAKLLPPVSGVYHSAFPDFMGTEDKVSTYKIRRFEKLSGKHIVWVYFSNNWIKNIKFPKSQVRITSRAGSIPYIRMMPRTTFDQGVPDPVYSMQRIIDGDFDASLTQWAIDAKTTNIPLIIEFGTEVNGSWFPWNGAWNGGSVTTDYGDPNLPDGPERFRDAYRHIINIFRTQNVQNITWVFHVNAGSFPAEAWNSMAAYYPGDDYIDWIGVSVYGPQVPGNDWQSFTDILDGAYPELTTISVTKPLAVLEFGAVEQGIPEEKAQWVRDALQAIKSNRYPRIKAISYWHSKWRNADRSISNLKIDSSPAVLSAYKETIKDSFFVVVPTYSNLNNP
ncbi:MAG: glycosyl hydrolase [Bacteroidota bacterium]|nr:glycosyl hydrolase [Bacteroidota bacterium]